ncbi:MAG: hypothetical protein ACMV0Y_06395 [Paludibacter sp.]
MQNYLEVTPSDNPEELCERIKTLAVYQARSGFLLAEAKKTLSEKKKAEIVNTIIAIAKENYPSAKAQNALVDSIATDEQFMVDWLDRINAACKHQLDAVRSLLSFEKEVYKTSNYGNS